MPIIQDQEYFREHGKLVYNDTVQKNFEIMSKSSDCRIYFNKNAATASYKELLLAAINCIADLTGDEVFRTRNIQTISEREDAS